MIKTTLAILLSCLATAQVRSAGPMTHFRIEVDAYISDPHIVCRQAWDAALAEMGPGTAEMVTMTQGQWDVRKCVAAAYQLGAPRGVVSAGMDVREAE